MYILYKHKTKVNTYIYVKIKKYKKNFASSIIHNDLVELNHYE